ncbi:helix-turn-helix domain-containing protein [Roseomonas sp. E05]|uniref:helix-turn-helix domain-containing protein n=1 Tax=Roseomonas sp. E05 TaxID=3046310 RepID=UPI0024BA3F37|nr:helix-turn-helix domain-containing protein [Roseomonas sp. E05]MDJ0391360.1 helix-turn-helix domain-containing protein [Roseomonas sp. E05]
MEEPSRYGTAAPAFAGMAARASRREPITYTVNDAAAVSGLSRATLYRLAADGRLRLVKVGSRTLVDATSLRALLGVAA